MSNPANSTAQQCEFCGAGVGDGATLCPACVRKVNGWLFVIGELGADLVVTITRQDVIRDDRPSEYQPVAGPVQMAAADLDPRGRPWPGSLRPTALPYASGPADLARTARAALASWCRLVADELRPDADPRTDLPEPSLEAMGAWLEARSGWWRRQPWAAEFADAMAGLSSALERAVDRRAPQTYAGPCGAVLGSTEAAPGAVRPQDARTCPTHLYADAGASLVACPTCGARHDVHRRRTELLELAQDRLAHAELVAGALSGLGVAVTVDQVNGWARRGRLVTHGRDRLNRKLYRVGDALAVATELMAAQHQRRAKRRAS